jgi:hypothetical protein
VLSARFASGGVELSFEPLDLRPEPAGFLLGDGMRVELAEVVERDRRAEPESSRAAPAQALAP